MKLKTCLCLLILVALTIVWIPTVAASSSVAPPQEMATLQKVTTDQILVTDSMRSAGLTFGELPDFLKPVQSAACSNDSCTTICRAQGYDYGLCFISTCICRFYFP